MADPVADPEALAISVANRLRMVQSDLDAEPAEVRQQYLTDEIERALGRLVPDQRPTFLERLQEFFPTWESEALTTAQAKGGAAGTMSSATDQDELNDASFLVDRLVRLAPSLKPGERSAAAARLRDAGLSAEGRHAWPETVAATIVQQLKLADDAAIDPARSVELLHLLLDVVLRLDQLVWTTWRTLAPRSDFRGAGELRTIVPKYLTGADDVAKADVTRQVERFRQLAAALVAATSRSGEQFAQQHYARFAPSQIEQRAKQEKGAFESTGVACWRTYVDLFGKSDQVTIERELLNLVAEYAERLISGARG